MDATEYNAWAAWMKSCRGLWTIDPIHDGVHRDLIAFRPSPDGEDGSGSYIAVDGATITAGRYEGGYSRVTDGIMIPLFGMTMLGQPMPAGAEGCRKPTNEATTLVFERMGVRFLRDVWRVG